MCGKTGGELVLKLDIPGTWLTDKETGAVVPYGRIKPVLIVSIHSSGCDY